MGDRLTIKTVPVQNASQAIRSHKETVNTKIEQYKERTGNSISATWHSPAADKAASVLNKIERFSANYNVILENYAGYLSGSVSLNYEIVEEGNKNLGSSFM